MNHSDKINIKRAKKAEIYVGRCMAVHNLLFWTKFLGKK